MSLRRSHLYKPINTNNFFKNLHMLKLKKYKNKKSELYGTPGENVRDALIKAGIKTAEEAAYAAGNTTEQLVDIASKSGTIIDRATELGLGTESAGALGRVVFKATKDASRGDTVCTGLCLISGTCETVALCCSTIKVIPFRGRIYVGAKIISKGCITFRNACVGEGC